MRPLTLARRTRAATAPLLAAALSLGLLGCQAPNTGPGASLAADVNDPCQAERSAFAASRTYFQDQIISGAVTGAAVGAGAGALSGLAICGNLKSALIGGAVGGAVGGIAGAGTAYYNTLVERAADQNELAADMSQDLARESREIDHTAATFARLRACRFAQARFLKNQARRGAIDRSVALSYLTYERNLFDEEIRVAHEFGLTMARRGQQFQEATNDLKTRPAVNAQGAPVRRAAPARVAQVDRTASVSVPEKRASYDNTVASAERNGKAAFDIDNNANLSWLLIGLDA